MECPFRLTPFQSTHAHEAAALYEASFPLSERRPTDKWLAMCQGGHGAFRAVVIVSANEGSDGQVLGFITYWQLPSCHYIEHFAVSPQCRGKGIGAAAFSLLLNEVKSHSTMQWVLEVEPPHTPMAARRIAFYERLGMHLNQQSYHQPPYRPGDAWLPLYIMSARPITEATEWQKMVSDLHRIVYGMATPESEDGRC